jgi:addiction module HigA family antidote
MAAKPLSPMHPGEVLLQEFLQPLGLTQYRLAKTLKVPPRRINEIVERDRHGDRIRRDVPVFRRAS